MPVYEGKVIYIYIYFELIKKPLGITWSGKTSQVEFTFKDFSPLYVKGAVEFCLYGEF